MIYLFLIFLLAQAWGYDQYNVTVPEGYQWICETFSLVNKYRNIEVSENQTYASCSKAFILGETPLEAKRPSGDNKYLIPIQQTTHTRSGTFIGVARNLDPLLMQDINDGLVPRSEQSRKPANFVLKYTNSRFYLENTYYFGTKGPHFKSLKQGEIFYVMLDMDQGQVSFHVEGSDESPVVVSSPMLKEGTWFVAVVFDHSEEGFNFLHDPEGCILGANSRLYKELSQRFHLRLDLLEKMRMAAASDEFTLEKGLVQAAYASPARLQELSVSLSNNSEVEEGDILGSILDIAMTPMIPSGLCISDDQISTLLENKKLEAMSQVVQLALTLNATSDPPLQAALQLSLHSALIAYPLEDESLKNDYRASLRDTVYAKLNEMRGYLKKAPLPEFHRLVGSPHFPNSDSFLDMIIAECLQAVAAATSKKEANPIKMEELEQIAKLKTKYADIWI